MDASQRHALGGSERALRQRVRALEQQLRGAEDALQRRYPDSIANLVRAVGPSEQDTAATRALERRVEEQDAVRHSS